VLFACVRELEKNHKHKPLRTAQPSVVFYAEPHCYTTTHRLHNKNTTDYLVEKEFCCVAILNASKRIRRYHRDTRGNKIQREEEEEEED